MPYCTVDRWGKGTCSSVPKTSESKEMDDKLKKMMQERTKQDTMWQEPSATKKDKK